MKYLAGISLPSVVCAELGKNDPFGPSPSPSMVPGAISGLLIGVDEAQRFTRAKCAPHPISAATATNAAHCAMSLAGTLESQLFARNQLISNNNPPANEKIACTSR